MLAVGRKPPGRNCGKHSNVEDDSTRMLAHLGYYGCGCLRAPENASRWARALGSELWQTWQRGGRFNPDARASRLLCCGCLGAPIASHHTLGCCWVAQWNAPNPKIKSEASTRTISRSG
jgi:hypothetical protein